MVTFDVEDVVKFDVDDVKFEFISERKWVYFLSLGEIKLVYFLRTS